MHTASNKMHGTYLACLSCGGKEFACASTPELQAGVVSGIKGTCNTLHISALIKEFRKGKGGKGRAGTVVQEERTPPLLWTG
eukprot:scaffold10942_cov17-Tisochrysis_lutea.AAC.2